jgi:hypothetical protein
VHLNFSTVCDYAFNSLTVIYSVEQVFADASGPLGSAALRAFRCVVVALSSDAGVLASSLQAVIDETLRFFAVTDQQDDNGQPAAMLLVAAAGHVAFLQPVVLYSDFLLLSLSASGSAQL